MSQNNELRAAALEVIEFQRQEALDRYGDAEKAESWACVRVLRAALAAQTGQSDPYAYAVYFPDQPTEMLAHELDDLCEDMTNREHSVTELFTHPAPVRQPLSDDELDLICEQALFGRISYQQLARSIETAHGITAQGAAHD